MVGISNYGQTCFLVLAEWWRSQGAPDRAIAARRRLIEHLLACATQGAALVGSSHASAALDHALRFGFADLVERAKTAVQDRVLASHAEMKTHTFEYSLYSRPPMSFTVDQVSALAPDASALAAGRKLSSGRDWSGLGRSAFALWGECKGSAAYQVRVDLSDLAAKCSCPSRKFPCKHAIGLLLMAAERPGALPESSQPEWVADWLAKRHEAAEKREKRKEERATAAPNPEAQARRAEKRQDRVLEGLGALDLWMADLARTGLASLDGKGPALFQNQAARMVDAQAPGIAGWLRRMAGIPGSGRRWPEQLVTELGRLALLSHAYRRLDALDAPLQADVRSLIGFTLDREEVAAQGERVVDEWAIVAQEHGDDERVRLQRNWLHGRRSGRWALVLQFAAGTAPFPDVLAPGAAIDAELAFWPSAFPLRALVRERRGAAPPVAGSIPGAQSIPQMLDAAAVALAAQPWLDSVPSALARVRPAYAAAREQWSLVDEMGAAVPLDGREPWRLLALSGGHPVDVVGEWDGLAFRALSAVADGAFESLVARTP